MESFTISATPDGQFQVEKPQGTIVRATVDELLDELNLKHAVVEIVVRYKTDVGPGAEDADDLAAHRSGLEEYCREGGIPLEQVKAELGF
jgi:hypothetical protein